MRHQCYVYILDDSFDVGDTRTLHFIANTNLAYVCSHKQSGRREYPKGLSKLLSSTQTNSRRKVIVLGWIPTSDLLSQE